MQPALKTYTEPMQKRELTLLQRKAIRGRTTHYRIFGALVTGSCLLPLLLAWRHLPYSREIVFSSELYFTLATILLSLSVLGAFWMYRFAYYNIWRDIRLKTKTIARLPIIRKHYLVRKDLYYFYIGSPVKLFIEVSSYDYYSHRNGDEVSIEYATHSKEYLGYF